MSERYQSAMSIFKLQDRTVLNTSSWWSKSRFTLVMKSVKTEALQRRVALKMSMCCKNHSFVRRTISAHCNLRNSLILDG